MTMEAVWHVCRTATVACRRKLTATAIPPFATSPHSGALLCRDLPIVTVPCLEIFQGSALLLEAALPAFKAANAAFRQAQTAAATMSRVIQEPAVALLFLQQLTSSAH